MQQVESEGPYNTGIRLGDNEGYHGWRSETGTKLFRGNHGDVVISDNTIKNNTVGLDATAWNNHEIDVSSNRFKNNEVGMWVSSGLVNLTHTHTVDADTPDEREVGNVFTGGRDAMVFGNGPLHHLGDEDFGDEESRFESKPFDAENGFGHTGLSLVGDTLGHTVFDGQQGYYVALYNGALFNPGTPTIISGLDATYDGVHGGLMTPAQLSAIEGKLRDFDDFGTLGQIFAGFTADFDDNQILQKILGNQFSAGRAGIIVTGLPNTGGGGTGGGLSLADLANIAPAAGGDDEQQFEHGACWGNLGAISGNRSVSFDLSQDPTQILADQAECEGGI